MGKLILTRKPGESVKIGKSTLTVREVHAKKVYIHVAKAAWVELGGSFDAGGAVVTIAAISGRQVRLHFEADNSVKIVRTELL